MTAIWKKALARKRTPRKKPPRWLDTLPPQVKIILGWLPPILWALLKLMALFVCLTLLLYAGLAPQLVVRPAENALQVQLDYDPNTESFAYHGQAPGAAYVEIRFQDRLLDTRYVPTSGEFESPYLKVPRPVLALSFIAYDSLGKEVLGEQTIYDIWMGDHPFPPTLDIAIFIPEENALWIAGQLTPGERALLETPDGQLIGDYIFGYQQGIFDEVIHLEGTDFEKEPPSSVRIRLKDDYGDLQGLEEERITSTPQTPLTIHIASLPLRRRMELHFNASQPSIHLEISLPRNHPYFTAMAQGLLRREDFVNTVLGGLPTYELSFIDHLQIQPESGSLQLDGTWPKPLSTFLFVPAKRGVGSIPFRPGKDVVEVHLEEGVRLDRVQPLQEVNQTEGNIITWRPSPQEVSEVSDDHFEIQLKLPPDVQAIDAPSIEPTEQSTQATREEEETKFREFLAGFEYSNVNDIVRFTIRALELLIPFGLVFLYARRRRLGRTEIWTPLAALALVLGVLSTWWYLRFTVEYGLGNWLARIVGQLLYEVIPYGFSSEFSQQIRDSGSNAFILILLALASQAPFYLLAVEHRLENPTQPPGKKRLWRRLLRLLGILTRILIALLVFVVLAYAASIHNPLVESQTRQARFVTQLQEGNWLLPPALGGPQGRSIELRTPLSDAAETVLDVLVNRVTWALLIILLVGVLFALLNWRGILYWSGLLLVFLRLLQDIVSIDPNLLQVYSSSNQFDYPGIPGFERVPWWIVLAVAGLLAYPLMRWLVELVGPGSRLFRPHWWGGLVTVAILVIALALPHILIRPLQIAGGALFFAGVAWAVVFGLRTLSPLDTIFHWAWDHKRWFAVVLLVLSLTVIIPLPANNPIWARYPGLSAVGALVGELDGLFFYILGFALILALRDYAFRYSEDHVILPQDAIELAMFLFAVFLINSSASFIFIPIPLIVGWIMARYWLFRPAKEVEQMEPALEIIDDDRSTLILDTLGSVRARRSMDSIRSALDKKLESAELTPEEHKEKLDGYTEYLRQGLELESVTPGIPSNRVVFAVGDGSLWEHTRLFLQYGAVLATIPILIALYEYLPKSTVTTPYPLAQLLVFLLRATFSWLVYAFFFGYFYVHLRGNSGLTKGLYLFVALAVPYAALYFLRTETLTELRSFLFWLMQVFLFCTLLGLLAVENRLLRQNGKTMRDLIEVHNLPALALYVSSIVAFVAPTIPTLLRGEMGKLVEFFINAVVQGTPTSGP